VSSEPVLTHLQGSPWQPDEARNDREQFDRVVRLLTIVAVAVGAEGVLVGLLTREPAALAMSLVLASFATWVVWAGPRINSRGAAWFVVRLSIVILLALVLLLQFVPAVGPGMTALALIPMVIGMPYLPSRALRRLAVLAWMMCVAIALSAEAFAVAINGEPRVELHAGLLRVTSVAVIAGIILVLLWQFRDRVSESAREMTALMRMSRDLSRLHDPADLGQAIARHLAMATGARACIVSGWVPEERRVVAVGSYSAEGLPALESGYALAQYPLIRRVLETGEPVSVQVAADDADPAEVAYLRSLGHETLLMLPLSAQGETVGLAKLSGTGRPFGSRVVSLASMLATEAALSLVNARLYDELRHQSFHDSLTGLANRALFLDRLEHALARGERRRTTSAILVFDIDEFKAINDRLGHAVGDRLLVALAARLRGCVRSGDTAARLGGDEFGVLVEELNGRHELEAIAHRIAESMAEPVVLDGHQVSPSVSIGVCFSDDGGETADVLMRNADFAMYWAKRSGKPGVVVFRPILRVSAAERRELEEALPGAVDRGELHLRFQPVVSLQSGAITRVEALLRWDRPGRREPMPAVFIDVAEKTGQITTIGRWVLREARRHARRWQRMPGHEGLMVGVNLSAQRSVTRHSATTSARHS
jgi:diguanylate cyclase (GGDEF)-like protein